MSRGSAGGVVTVMALVIATGGGCASSGQDAKKDELAQLEAEKRRRDEAYAAEERANREKEAKWAADKAALEKKQGEDLDRAQAEAKKADADKAAARRDYLAKRDGALKNVEARVDLVELMNAPGKWKQKTVKTRARWGATGQAAFGDDVGTGDVISVELRPPLRVSPTTWVAIDKVDFEADLARFSGLEGAEVELVLRVYGDAPGPQAPCVARILQVTAK